MVCRAHRAGEGYVSKNPFVTFLARWNASHDYHIDVSSGTEERRQLEKTSSV